MASLVDQSWPACGQKETNTCWVALWSHLTERVTEIHPLIQHLFIERLLYSRPCPMNCSIARFDGYTVCSCRAFGANIHSDWCP